MDSLDIERDKKVCDVQIPELRSNLTKPRSLRDPLVFDGHTTSYDHHTFHWRMMHGKREKMPIKHIFHQNCQCPLVWNSLSNDFKSPFGSISVDISQTRCRVIKIKK